MERTGALLRRRFGETRVAIHRRPAERPGRGGGRARLGPAPRLARAGSWFPLEGSAAGEAIAIARRASSIPCTPPARAIREEPLLAALGYGSLVSFPLVFEDQILGALDIAHPPAEGLLDCCFQVARQVAHLVAIALHN